MSWFSCSSLALQFGLFEFPLWLEERTLSSTIVSGSTISFELAALTWQLWPLTLTCCTLSDSPDVYSSVKIDEGIDITFSEIKLSNFSSIFELFFVHWCTMKLLVLLLFLVWSRRDCLANFKRSYFSWLIMTGKFLLLISLYCLSKHLSKFTFT